MLWGARRHTPECASSEPTRVSSIRETTSASNDNNVKYFAYFRASICDSFLACREFREKFHQGKYTAPALAERSTTTSRDRTMTTQGQVKARPIGGVGIGGERRASRGEQQRRVSADHS